MIQIKINGTQGVLQNMKRFPIRVQEAIKVEANKSAFNIDAQAKRTLSSGAYPYSNGQLAQSIHVGGAQLGVSEPKFGAVVGTTKSYSVAVEMGSKPHTIRPKYKKVLAWQARAGFMGRGIPLWVSASTGNKVKNRRDALWIFAKEVHHPGNRPKPFLGPAANAEAPRFFERVKRLIATV